jgi:hypothetical protein
MVKDPQKITSDDCIKWKQNKAKNPLTGYEFKTKEKSKEYKRFAKECEGFKTPEQPEVLSVPIKGQKVPITPELCHKWLKSNKMNNPITGNLIDEKAKLYKDIENACIKLKIIDPKTKKAIIQTNVKESSIDVKKETKNPKYKPKKSITDKDCIEWKKNKLRNPLTKTHNPIKENGEIYNKLKEACVHVKTPETSTVIKKSSSPKKRPRVVIQKEREKERSKESIDSKKPKIIQFIQPEEVLSNDKTYYPSLDDIDFNKNLLALKEIRVHKINEYPKIKTLGDFENKAKDLCSGFDKSLFQYLTAHYLSYRTPYKSLLLYYSVGVGKTCTAITIAESLLINHNSYEEPKIWVILPGAVEGGFKNQIFDAMRMIDFSTISNQCTGDTYVKLAQLSKETDMKVVEKRIKKIIKSRYAFFTYDGFANFIDINYKQKGRTVKDKVIIVDEAHNIRSGGEDDENKRVYNALLDVCRNGVNNRLVLLTATPMYNEPTDIYNLFYLLLVNDKREELYNGNLKIFTATNQLTEDAKKFIGQMSSNYISYLRGKNPFNFAFKLSPKLSNIPILEKVIPNKDNGQPIDDNDKNWITKMDDGIVVSNLSKNQVKYLESKIEKNDDKQTGVFNTQQPMNIVYDTTTGKEGFNNFFIREGTKEQLILRYASKYTNALSPDANHLGLYSGKFLNIANIIKKSKGIVVIYSQFIWSGVLPLAIMLEHMGYTREGTANLLSEPQITTNVTYDGVKNPKYCILSSSDPEIMGNTTIDGLISRINNPANINGALVKVILMTPVAGEGLNFYNVREMHITDPWYHFNKIDQIIGRGIRNCSHKRLPVQDRNVTVFMHCSINGMTNETSDIHAYRIATRKLYQSFVVDEVIRNNAIDCSLFKNINYFPQSLFEIGDIDINTSQGVTIKYKLGDNEKYKPVCKVNMEDIKEKTNGFREETYKHLALNIQTKLRTLILELIHKNQRFLSYETIKNSFDYVDIKILMHSIKMSIYPNTIIDNIILLPHEEGIHIIDVVEDTPLKINLTKEKTEEKEETIIINPEFYKTIANIDKGNYFNSIISLYLSMDEITFKLLIRRIFTNRTLNLIDSYIENCFVKEGVLIKPKEIPSLASSEKYVGFVNIYNEEFEPYLYNPDGVNHKSLNQKQKQQLIANRRFVEKPDDFTKEIKPWGLVVPIFTDKEKKNKMNVFKLLTTGVVYGKKTGIVCTSLKKPEHVKIFNQLNLKDDKHTKFSYCNTIAVELFKLNRLTLLPEYKPI